VEARGAVIARLRAKREAAARIMSGAALKALGGGGGGSSGSGGGDGGGGGVGESPAAA
jgi:hypothetical protein